MCQVPRQRVASHTNPQTGKTISDLGAEVTESVVGPWTARPPKAKGPERQIDVVDDDQHPLCGDFEFSEKPQRRVTGSVHKGRGPGKRHESTDGHDREIAQSPLEPIG